VRGMRLQSGQKVVSLMVVSDPEGLNNHVLTVTKNGYGKRTKLEEYRLVGRGAQGVVSIQTTERNGEVVKAVLVNDSDEILLITSSGVLVRTRAEGISLIGRNTQGVKLINLTEGEDEFLVGLQRVDEPTEEELEAHAAGPKPKLISESEDLNKNKSNEDEEDSEVLSDEDLEDEDLEDEDLEEDDR